MDWYDPPKRRWFNLRVVAWAMFDTGATVFSMLVISRYFGPWVVKEMGGKVGQFNDAIWISLLVAATIQILLSPISDELGRRRVFVVGFTLLCVSACSLMGVGGTLTRGLLLFGVANVGYQTAMVFYNAMLGDVADQRHMARISGIGVGIGYVGSIVGLLISARYVDTESHHYSSAFPLAAIMFLGFALPLFLFVKEKPSLVRLNLAQSLTNSIGSFVTTLRRVARHREMLYFFIGCLLALDAVNAVTVNMSLYCEDVVGLDPVEGFTPMWMGHALFGVKISQIDLFLIISTVFAIFGSFIIGHISDKTSHYKTLLVVLVLWMAALVLAMFGVGVHKKLFWFTGPMFGLGFGGIWTVSRAYLQELCHPEERSQMFAIFGLVGRYSAIIGTFAWSQTFHLCNYFQIDERKASRISIAVVLVLLCIGFWVLLNARPKAENPRR